MFCTIKNMANTDTQITSNDGDVDEDIIRLGPDVPHHRLLTRKRSPPPDDFVFVERQPFTEPIWGKVVNK